MESAATTHIVFPSEGYYLFLNGQNVGPINKDLVIQKFQAGEYLRETPLWFPGLTNWITVGDMPDLDRRKTSPAEVQLPEKLRPTDLIVTLKGVALALQPQSIKALVSAEDLRRTDLTYDESAQKWIRADQHPEIKTFYSMPNTPSPLPPLEQSKASAPEATASATPASGIKPKSAPTADPTNSKRHGLLFWALLVVVVFGLLAALWYTYPQIKRLISFAEHPATLSPATITKGSSNLIGN